jgi:DNA-binding XRE family transcriptional regulator
MTKTDFKNFKLKHNLKNKEIAKAIGITHQSVLNALSNNGKDSAPVWAKLAMYMEERALPLRRKINH